MFLFLLFNYAAAHRYNYDDDFIFCGGNAQFVWLFILLFFIVVLVCIAGKGCYDTPPDFYAKAQYKKLQTENEQLRRALRRTTVQDKV